MTMFGYTPKRGEWWVVQTLFGKREFEARLMRQHPDGYWLARTFKKSEKGVWLVTPIMPGLAPSTK